MWLQFRRPWLAHSLSLSVSLFFWAVSGKPLQKLGTLSREVSQVTNEKQYWKSNREESYFHCKGNLEARLTMGASYLQNSFGQACFLSKLLEVLGVRVVVDGEVGFHGPQLVMLEGGAHALGLLRGRVRLLIPVQVVGLVLVTTCGSHRGRKEGLSARACLS